MTSEERNIMQIANKAKDDPSLLNFALAAVRDAVRLAYEKEKKSYPGKYYSSALQAYIDQLAKDDIGGFAVYLSDEDKLERGEMDTEIEQLFNELDDLTEKAYSIRDRLVSIQDINSHIKYVQKQLNDACEIITSRVSTIKDSGR